MERKGEKKKRKKKPRRFEPQIRYFGCPIGRIGSRVAFGHTLAPTRSESRVFYVAGSRNTWTQLNVSSVSVKRILIANSSKRCSDIRILLLFLSFSSWSTTKQSFCGTRHSWPAAFRAKCGRLDENRVPLSLEKIICRKFRDVYFIIFEKCANAHSRVSRGAMRAQNARYTRNYPRVSPRSTPCANCNSRVLVQLGFPQISLVLEYGNCTR